MITRCIKERSWIFEKATLGMLVLQCLLTIYQPSWGRLVRLVSFSGNGCDSGNNLLVKNGVDFKNNLNNYKWIWSEIYLSYLNNYFIKCSEKKISISVQRLVVSIIAYNNITKNPTFLTYIKLIIMLYPRYKIKLILDRVI